MRYFFHVRDRRGAIRDEEGTELCGLVAARAEAFHSARDFAIEDIRCGGPVLLRQIETANSDGKLLGIMPVIDIVH